MPNKPFEYSTPMGANPQFKRGVPEFGNDELSKKIYEAMMKDGLPEGALPSAPKPEPYEPMKQKQGVGSFKSGLAAGLALAGDSGPSSAYWDKLDVREAEDQLTSDAEDSALAPYEQSKRARVARDFMDSLAPGLGDSYTEALTKAYTRKEPGAEHPGDTISELSGVAATSKPKPPVTEVPTDAGGKRVYNRMYPEPPKVERPAVAERPGRYKVPVGTKRSVVESAPTAPSVDISDVKGNFRPDPESLRAVGINPDAVVGKGAKRVSQTTARRAVNMPSESLSRGPNQEAMVKSGVDYRTGKPIKKEVANEIMKPADKAMKKVIKYGGPAAGLAAALWALSRRGED